MQERVSTAARYNETRFTRIGLGFMFDTKGHSPCHQKNVHNFSLE